jgi:geranylgeranyl pyrophosphate synthase
MLLKSAAPADRDRYCEWILAETPEATASLLRSAGRTHALRHALEYGQRLVDESKSQLDRAPVNEFSQALLSLATTIGALFEQFRS